MTTKTISGTYSAGYLLSSAFSTVSITSSGSVGGFGLLTNGYASVVNAGRIEASLGSNGVTVGIGGGSVFNALTGTIDGGVARTSSGENAAGYAGGAGLYISVSGALGGNQGNIIGGAGGAGVAGISAGHGGAGGAGLVLHGGGYAINENLLQGGAGGTGGAGFATNPYSPGIGGIGGAGAGFTAAGTLVNSAGEIYGGSGGHGGYGPGFAAVGGAGGDGVDLATGDNLGNLHGLIRGGVGGTGGNTAPGFGNGGQGGQGGAGVSLSGAGTVASEGAIDGGAGGVGGGPVNTVPYGGPGGNGGTGVILAAGGELLNSGTIHGGVGGNQTNGESPLNAGGRGGIGALLVNGGTVLNYGVIAGALGGVGSEYAIAGDGIAMSGAGAITNGSGANAGALIAAGSTNIDAEAIGIDLGAGSQVTVTNFGTISGYAAVRMQSSLDTLVVEAGSAFIGSVSGYGSTLVLASGVGAVTGFGDGFNFGVSGSMAATNFYDFTTVKLGAGTTFTMAAGADVVSDGLVTDTLVNAGTLKVAGTLSVEGVLEDNGKLTGLKHTALVIDGGIATFGKGATLSTPTVTVSGAAHINVATSLKIAGVWDQTGGTLTVTHAKTMTFTGSGSTFSGLLTETGPGIADLMFASTGAATDTLNAVTINALRVNLTNTNFLVGSGGATITNSAALDFDGTGAGILGSGSTDVLTNNGGLFGSGAIGQGQMGLINNGQIVSQDVGAPGGLTISTGAGENINNDAITADSTNGITVVSGLVNNSLVIAEMGTLTMEGAVTGDGSGQVDGGTLFAASSFNQAVTFTSTNGELELAHGLAYTATISGFSRAGRNYLDLNDVSFVSASEATFAGTAAGGTLTVADGVHTARISMAGNYLAATFVSASDGHGGVIIHVLGGAPVQTPHSMIAAISGWAPGAAAAATAGASSPSPAPANLFAPRGSLG